VLLNGAGNTVDVNSDIFSACCHHQGHVDSKTFLEQNYPLFNWGCRLTRNDLYDVVHAVSDHCLLFGICIAACSATRQNVVLLCELLSMPSPAGQPTMLLHSSISLKCLLSWSGIHLHTAALRSLVVFSL